MRIWKQQTNTELGDLDNTGILEYSLETARPKSWQVRVELLIAGDYRVKCNDVSRFYTDDTLPEGLRHPLGMLMFGAKDKSLGQVINPPFIPLDADRAFFVIVDDATMVEMFGANDYDPRG